MCWDSCVFIRYLTQSPPDCVSDIDQYIQDVQANKRTVYFSSLVYTEIRPRFLRHRGILSIQDFFADLGATFTAIDPNPNILMMAGEMRDIDTANPSDPNTKGRVLGTPDSIHLATCLYLRDILGVSDVVFHTFDDGKGSNWEGRCVPLLSFQNWYPNSSRPQVIQDVCNLPRRPPLYPQPLLFPTAP